MGYKPKKVKMFTSSNPQVILNIAHFISTIARWNEMQDLLFWALLQNSKKKNWHAKMKIIGMQSL